ncbi:MAG: septal ring lytic transglycosylase RlpA family protein [Bacteroidota bacterium]
MKYLSLLFVLFATALSSTLSAQQLTGKASYYADRFHGRPTSIGELYNKDAFTAASKELPVGTIVKVRNIANNKVTQVRINDCGPHHPQRIIDLSRAAAAQIDLLRAGVAMVQLEIVSLGTDGLACDRSKQTKKGTASTTVVPSSPATYGNATIPTYGSAPVVPPAPAPAVTNVEKDASMPTGTDIVFPLYGIQVAAYGNAANAIAFMNGNASEGLGYLFIRTDSKLSRVFAGPYLNRQAAEAAMAKMKTDKKIKGLVVRQIQ